MYNRDNNFETQDIVINDCYHIIDEKYVNINALLGANKYVIIHIKMSEFKQMVRSLQSMDIDDNDSCSPRCG